MRLLSIRSSYALLIFTTILLSHQAWSQVAIGTNSTSPTPNANAVLLLEGNGKQGLIIPVGDRNNVATPVKGMLIFDTNQNQVYYNTTGTASGWVAAGGGGGSQGIQISGNLVSLNSTSGATFPLASSAGPVVNQNGQLLMWNQTNARWEATTGSSIADGNVLTWNGTTNRWEPRAALGGGTITGVTAGTGLTGGAVSGNATLNVDVGTTANKIVQLNGTGKLPAVDGSLLTNLPAGSETDPTVKAINGLVKSNGTTISVATAGTDYLTPTGNGSALTSLNATNITSGTLPTARLDVGTTANKIVQLDGTGKLPAVDGSLLTNLAGGGDITGVTAGTGLTGGAASGNATLNVDIGTTANKIVQLDGTGKLPAVDGSLLTNLAGGGDITGVTAGTGLTGGAASGNATLNVDVGITANKIVQLDGTGKLPAVDGSLLTNLPAGSETDPTVKAINGLVKSNGTTISVATAGTDYLTPTGNGSALTSLNATNITSGTLPTARLDVGTTANKIVQLDGTGKLPAVDGSLLTNLAGGGDITGVTAGTGLTGGAASGNATLNVDVGITANKIVQLDGTGKLPAVDGSLLTNLPAGSETDPTVKAINGLVKSNGTTISAAAAGTDYLTPSGNGSALTSLNAANISSGTLPVARGGTGLTAFGGGILYASGPTTVGDIGNGTSGQMLLITGTSPSWQTMNSDATMSGTGVVTIANSAITDAKVATGISGSKIVPNFGSQNISTTGTLTTGTTGQFAVNATGNITKINNIATLFPTAQGGAGTVLTNDGAGTLSWAAGGSGWSFLGNPSRVDGAPGVGTNYIGTTDNVPLNFMVNNQRSGRIDPALFSTFFGFSSGQNNSSASNTGFGNFTLAANTSGAGNTAVGTSSLSSLTTGNNNTAVGNGALFNNVTGSSNAAFGNAALSNSANASGNTAMGTGSLQFTTTGNGNTAMGQSTLSANSTGGANTAVGSRALSNNTASNNTAVGNDALFTNTSAGDNAAFGVLSLAFNTAARNTGLGAYSLQSSTTGADNAGVGNSVLLSNTSGAQNTAVGSLAGYTSVPANANTTGSANTFIGYASGPSTVAQLTNATAIGASAVVGASNSIQLGNASVTTVNVGTGTTAKLVAGGLQITGGTLAANRVLTSDASGNATWQPAAGGSSLINNTGARNLFAGSTVPTTGTDNAFFGELAANSNTTGSFNVIIGTQAGQLKTSGDLNTIIGWQAGRAGTTHQGNTFVGAQAGELTNAAGATLNSFFGEKSGQGNLTGNGGTFIGDRAGISNTTGDNNTSLGSYSDMGAVSLSNATAIGFRAMVAQSNSLVLGSISGVNGATANTSVGIGTTTPAQRFHINEPSANQVYMRITNTAATSGINIGLGGAGSQEAFIANNQNSPMYFQTNATNRMTIDATGNVGIGTITPGAALDITGAANGMRINSWLSAGSSVCGIGYVGTNLYRNASDNVWKFTNSNGTIGGTAINFADCSGTPNQISFVRALGPSTANANAAVVESMRIDQNGYVGIGTTTPGVPLDIATTPTGIFLSGGSNVFFNSLNGGTLSTGTNPTPQISVRATGAFLSTGSSTNGGFYVTSDERIKRKVGVSDSRNDLATLMKLNITDYKYVDSLSAGNVQVKGVFAQQVETVYPQAISKQTSFIPNIYAMSNRAEFNAEKQTLIVTMAKPHYFVVGDKVKLISNISGEKPSIVAAVDGNTFTVANWTEKSEKIFVYGKEVNDFRIVDYDRLFTLNLSATQELNKKLETQQRVIDSLQSQDAESKKKIASLEASLSKVIEGEKELNNFKKQNSQLHLETLSSQEKQETEIAVLKKQMEEVLRIVGAEAKKK